MANEADCAAVIKETQNSLGKYVKRPQLTEKLLKKPPFRFLHDIITSVLKSTGFFGGLFDEKELISENVKDKESKIQYLSKVISVLEKTTGKSISAKPSKVVAGQEPEKTNEFLQCLAYALDQKLSSDEAVKQIKGLNKTQIPAEKNKSVDNISKKADQKSLRSVSNDKLTTQKKVTKAESNNEKNIKKDSKSKSTLKPNAKLDPDVKKESVNDKKNILRNGSLNKKRKDTHSEEQLEDTLLDINTSQENAVQQKDSTSTFIVNEESSVEKMTIESYKNSECNLSSSSQDLLVDTKLDTNELNSKEKVKELEENRYKNHLVENENNDSVLAKDFAPDVEPEVKGQSSAEKREIIVNIKEDLPETHHQPPRPSSVRPSSSRPGAPRVRDKRDNALAGSDNFIVGKVNIIKENVQVEEEENSIIIVNTNIKDDENELIDVETNEHGHLVQQILDATKEYSQTSTKTEIEWQVDATKSKEASNQEVEIVRHNIQALSRVANPLGKMLDHIQEDVEVMRQELLQWTNTYEKTLKELLKEQKANEDYFLPLHSKLHQLDGSIEEKRDKINDLKVTIHKNYTRINKLLSDSDIK